MGILPAPAHLMAGGNLNGSWNELTMGPFDLGFVGLEIFRCGVYPVL